MSRPRHLLFVSSRYLFPTDSGGKIRTVNILRGMKGGVFEITLASPRPAVARPGDPTDIDGICDRLLLRSLRGARMAWSWIFRTRGFLRHRLTHVRA